LGEFPETKKAIPTIRAATTTTMPPLRMRVRFFLAWASAARRASLAAR
jgi:hypothetical protein